MIQIITAKSANLAIKLVKLAYQMLTLVKVVHQYQTVFSF